jgi:hypothetical protein
MLTDKYIRDAKPKKSVYTLRDNVVLNKMWDEGDMPWLKIQNVIS